MDSDLAILLDSISLTEEELPATPLPLEMKPCNLADSGMYMVFNQRLVNPEAFTRTMKVAFNLIKQVEIKSLGQNRFTLRFSNPRDFNRILNDAPWHYEHHLLLLTPLPRDKQWDEVDLDWVFFQVQVRGIPFVSYSEELARIIGNRIGRFVDTDLNQEGLSKDAALRFRASIDTRRPVRRIVRLQSAAGNIITGFLSYEKLRYYAKPVACSIMLRKTRSQTNTHLRNQSKTTLQMNQRTNQIWTLSYLTQEPACLMEEIYPLESYETTPTNPPVFGEADQHPPGLPVTLLSSLTSADEEDVIMTLVVENWEPSNQPLTPRLNKRHHSEVAEATSAQQDTRAVKILKRGNQVEDSNDSAGLRRSLRRGFRV
ncbi:hypothetical protein M569_06361 [Genlisea aurea]|uniref:DUF4283 domain-containing protein n=1 Tax=Genlisea aurea TaxID=192259 RepID=S8E7M8_9LAMI|nr:hypothetical protein M569_06361 [Genlisea aurea]